jgi:flagellar basal-body rod protein FlgF
MGDGIYTALTGAIAQQGALDVIANNVANASTAGYRGDRAVFGEYVASARQQARAAAGPGQEPARPDHFVQVEAVVRDTQSGALRQTGNALDFGLQGDGFFVVQGPSGPRLTRAGSFMLRADGSLVTHEGLSVLGADGTGIKLPVSADGGSLVVGSSGEIAMGEQLVNRFRLVQVAEPSLLEKEGASYFVPPQGVALAAVDSVEVTQGYLESSNVNAVAGLNELISVNRSFDALQKVIETFQKLDERAARELGSRNT